MKKFILALSVLAASPAFANEAVPTPTPTSSDDKYSVQKKLADDNAEKKYFVGLRWHKNAAMSFDFQYASGGNVESRDKQSGIGFNFGQKVNDYFKYEFETSITSTEFMWSDERDTYTVWANMLNGYLGKKFSNGIEPYIGVGFGFSGINSVLDIYAYNLYIQDFEFDFSWQVMIGANFEINNRLDVNAGMKYHDYGTVNHNYMNMKVAHTDITAVGFYAGAVYKFNLF